MLRLFLLTIVFCAALISVNASEIVRFKITVDASLASKNQPLDGRILIFMTAQTKPLETIEPDFMNPNAVYIAGVEAKNLEAGKFFEVNADDLAFPQKFSDAPAGEYQVMALLDRDHSYTYDGMGAGDFYSAAVKVKMPSSAPTELTLTKEVPERKINLPKGVQVVEFESPMLSAFWGKPVKMRASVVLPPGYETSKSEKYPTVYSVHGYGGNHLKSLGGVPNMLKAMADGTRPEMIYVYLDAQCSLGHHVFADSANNGPWGTALVNEFIPYLEKQFRMDAKPSGRFLTGHSSGGWSTLWVMITHPDFFGGTWSTSPDPVDFRNFTGPDITKYPPNNAYTDANGKPYNLVRFGGKEIMSVKEYAQQEQVLGYYGGQFESFNAVFSPKGADGQPMPLFDVETGRIDPFVQKAWEKYDIAKVLQTNWTTLAPKLKGKLHIIVGTADTFHLNEAVALLDAELKKLGSDAKIEYIEGRNHFDLYEGGLSDRIAKEMYAAARPKAKAATK
ncbi:MAG: alpha/beta hydrolase-fold protein [Pyrinomonadaceae bacterium]